MHLLGPGSSINVCVAQMRHALIVAPEQNFTKISITRNIMTVEIQLKVFYWKHISRRISGVKIPLFEKTVSEHGILISPDTFS